MQQQISLREANQHLSQYIEAVLQGSEIIITKRGQPVARLLAIPKKRQLTTQQKKTWGNLLQQMRKGHNLNIKKFSREDVHDR